MDRIIITGDTDTDRADLRRMIDMAGIEYATRPEHPSDVVVAGRRPGSRLVRALLIGCAIISERELLDAIACEVTP